MEPDPVSRTSILGDDHLGKESERCLLQSRRSSDRGQTLVVDSDAAFPGVGVFVDVDLGEERLVEKASGVVVGF